MNFRDFFSRLTGGGETDTLTYVLPVAMLLLAIIVFYVVMMIVRSRRKGGPASLESMPYIDVTGLQKRGLLTPEETMRVRQALSKQVSRKSTSNSLPALQGELGLLADPEVQRLEMLAQQKAQERAQERRGQDVLQSLQPPTAPGARAEDSPSPQRHPVFWREDEEDGQPLPAADDVQLPPDVLKMAELGLITSEELENIKQRLRDKKREISGF